MCVVACVKRCTDDQRERERDGKSASIFPSSQHVNGERVDPCQWKRARRRHRVIEAEKCPVLEEKRWGNPKAEKCKPSRMVQCIRSTTSGPCLM